MPLLWLLLCLTALAAGTLAPSFPQDWAHVLRPASLGIAACCAALWLRALLRGRGREVARPILIDGSNVMHWNNGTPDIKVVRRLVDALQRNGFRVGVVFDANVGYKISDRFMNDGALARKLDLPSKQVMVAPKGTPADRFLLQAARDMNAPVVTNDRFRDWSDEFPEVTRPGRLIPGGYRKNAPYLKSPA